MENKEEPHIESEEARQERLQENWNQKMKAIEKIEDRLGKPVDEKIKEAVVALWAFDIPTSGSCEGHIEEGLPAPWIDIEALNRPEHRFVNEDAIYQTVAQKHNIPLERLKEEDWEGDRETLIKLWDELGKQEETEEYKKWKEANEALGRRIEELLEEFYRDRNTEVSMRLNTQIYDAGSIVRLTSGEKDAKPSKEFSEEERIMASTRLPQYQSEFEAFKEFLKAKYFRR